MSVKRYDLNNYNELMGNKLEYQLTENVVNILKTLALQLGTQFEQQPTHSYSESSSPHSHIKKRKYGYNGRKDIPDDSWQQLRTPFKPTAVMEKKEGSDKIMNDIRICLNKISLKNYENNRDLIIQSIRELVENNHMEDTEKIAHTIFEIASTNKFFSELYAELYKELIQQFSIFKDILNQFILGFTETMKNIKYVDPNDNYDEYCKYNKKNDARKATSVFITNLVKKGIVDPSTFSRLILEIQEIMNVYMDEPNRINEVEEITENLFLLITQSFSILLNIYNPVTLTHNAELSAEEIDTTKSIFDKIDQFSQLKVKEKLSISSRAIFKYMDILDKIAVYKL